jgi:hypothetical protein
MHVGNQQSRGIVIARLSLSVQSLLHQRQDLYQSTYLYLVEDEEPTSHQVVSDFRLPWGIIMCFVVSFYLYTKLHQKSQKNYTLFTVL